MLGNKRDNYYEDDLEDHFVKNGARVDMLIIGIALLNRRRLHMRKVYNHVVNACNPKSVYFSHWDRFNASFKRGTMNL